MQAQEPYAPNPLVTARLDAGLTQTQLAQRLKCSLNVVKWAEAGTYNSIPPCYHSQFELIDSLEAYQQFRRNKRTEFPNVRGRVVRNLADFLDEIGMLPNTFSMKACVPHAEVFRALTQGKISSSLREFFLTVGAEYNGSN
jgi:transcriptional regulator with XRE-family HTH domain